MPIRCRTVVSRLAEYQDGGGKRLARSGIRLHLALCHGCSAYLAQMKVVQSALAALGGPAEPDAETKSRLLERFRAWRGSKQG